MHRGTQSGRVGYDTKKHEEMHRAAATHVVNKVREGGVGKRSQGFKALVAISDKHPFVEEDIHMGEKT